MSVALLLIYQELLKGALISVVIAESLIFLITLVGIINRRSLVSLINVSKFSFRWRCVIGRFHTKNRAIICDLLLPLGIITCSIARRSESVV